MIEDGDVVVGPVIDLQEVQVQKAQKSGVGCLCYSNLAWSWTIFLPEGFCAFAFSVGG
jgi:hypothetical protein